MHFTRDDNTQIIYYSQVRQKALIMAEMMSFQQKRQDEDYKLAEEIDDLGHELNRSVYCVLICCSII